MLSAAGLDAAYGDTMVLRNVSLTVPDGSVVALLGANGAGKTTLLRAVSGLLRPRAGRVTFDGADVTRSAPNELARLGLHHIPEGRAIFPALTVAENLVVYSEKGREKESVERTVDAFPRLGQRLGQVAGTLSGGEQQMLALARAYVRRPRMVLLDEVSMGLAPQLVDEVLGFLDRLAKEGTALLLVEQYVNKALAIADYVYILNRGRISFAGEPSELAGEDVFERYLGLEVAHG
ncbi:MAG TPA: ABC transporter ATP-binding protein [Acidimicrobiia bacterium]